jgi:replicative DNA helicase
MADPNASEDANSAFERAARRILPSSVEAERALVCALINDPLRLADIAEVLEPEAFYDRRLRAVFEALVNLQHKNLPVDLISLAEELRSAGRFQELGGSAFLVEVARDFTSSALLSHHARIVAETATLRTLIRESTEIVAKAYETRPDGESVQKLLDESEGRIFSIASRGNVRHAEPIGNAITETFRRLDARAGNSSLTGLTTGFLDLDEMLCGLNKGELIVVAARPSMGKTAFALNLMENAAMSRPEWLERPPSVLMFSLEMGSQSLVSRMLCSRARVPAHLLRSGRIPGDLRRDLTMAADELQRTRISIDDTPGLSMIALRSRARRLHATEGLDMVVVDYLQLLSFPKAENRLQEISNISRSLKELSRDLEIPVVALAQLSRAVENREPPRPQLADLRESGSIEQDADVVLLLYRPEYYAKYRTEENLGLAEVIVAKHRNGPTGDVKLAFFPQHMRFENKALGSTEQINLDR